MIKRTFAFAFSILLTASICHGQSTVIGPPAGPSLPLGWTATGSGSTQVVTAPGAVGSLSTLNGANMIDCWGDSLTAGVNNGNWGMSYCTMLGQILHVPVYIGGISGQTSTQIATRATANMTPVTDPSAPTVTPTCTGSCTSSWGYEVTVNGLIDGTTKASTTTAALNNATLSGTNYNTITSPAECPSATYQVAGISNVAATTTVATITIGGQVRNDFYKTGDVITVTGLTNTQFNLSNQVITGISSGAGTITIAGTFSALGSTADTGKATKIPTYEVWRTAVGSSPTTVGQITNHVACGTNFSDTGLAGTAASVSVMAPASRPPTSNNTSRAGHAAVILEGYNDHGATVSTLTSAANASGGNTVYTGSITGGTGNALVGQQFVIVGFDHAANNGVFNVTASSSTSLTVNNTAGVSDTYNAGAMPTASFTIGANDLAIIAAMSTPNRFAILSVPRGSNDLCGTIPSSNCLQILGANAVKAYNFPNNYVNTIDPLVAAYNPALSQDVTDYGNKIVANSNRTDFIHETQYAYQIVAQTTAAFIKSSPLWNFYTPYASQADWLG